MFRYSIWTIETIESYTYTYSIFLPSIPENNVCDWLISPQSLILKLTFSAEKYTVKAPAITILLQMNWQYVMQASLCPSFKLVSSPGWCKVVFYHFSLIFATSLLHVQIVTCWKHSRRWEKNPRLDLLNTMLMRERRQSRHDMMRQSFDTFFFPLKILTSAAWGTMDI